MVIIAFTGYHDHGGDKDTLANIRSIKEFVVNVVPLSLKDQMNISTAGVAKDVNELELAGLTQTPSLLVQPPRVKEAPIHMECVLHQEIELPCTLANSQNVMVIGEVVGIHIDDAVLNNGIIDLDKIKPLARLGYQDYTNVEPIFKMVRPKPEDVEK